MPADLATVVFVRRIGYAPGPTMNPRDPLYGLRNIVGSTGHVAIVEGFSAPGDGGGGVFFWSDDTVTQDDGGTVIVPNSAWTIRVGSTTTPTTATYAPPSSRRGCWKRLYDGPINVRWFGTQRDGTTSDDGAFWLAIESLPNAGGAQGPAIYVPPGRYHLQTTIVIDKAVRLFGANGYLTNPSSILSFANDVTGIHVHGFTNPSDIPEPTRDAAGAFVQDLYLLGSAPRGIGATPRNPGNCGVLIHAAAHVERCLIQNFSGVGVAIYGSHNVSPRTYALCLIANCLIQLCDHGLTVWGDDAGAGTFNSVHCVGNREWGFWDDDSIGNTFLACQAEGNATSTDPRADGGSYKALNATAFSTFIGCYAEGRALVNSPNTIYGGALAGANAGNAMYFFNRKIGSVGGDIDIIDEIGINHDNNHPKTHFLPLTGDGRSAFAFRAEGGDTWRMLYLTKETGYGGCWGLRKDGSVNHPAFVVFDAEFWRSLTGLMEMPRGFVLGLYGGQFSPGIWINLAYSNDGGVTPIVGDRHSRGDILFQQDPVIGGNVGWVCVAPDRPDRPGTPGTPGTWRAFGEIKDYANTTPTRTGTVGQIVYNSAPDVGRPIGWVYTVSGAWRPFGAITT
ncbi:MAG: glycosyl hydrolase family 28-related protein [Pyrinomonadaceae bacterium]